MFCKWCGKKITNIGSPCPSCGKEQEPLESGNGFWDLCNKVPENDPIGSNVDANGCDEKLGKVSSSKKNKTKERKPAKKFWISAWAVTCVLLVVTIILVGVGMGKVGECLSEISALRSNIHSVNTLVTNGINQIEEYHQKEQEIPDTTKPQEEIEEVAKIDLDALLADGKEMLFDAEKLDIKVCEIETSPAKHVLVAVGELLEGENIKLFWQQSVDQGENWTTICEDISYILAEANETDAYRIICVVNDDSGVAQLYCAATIEVIEEVAKIDLDTLLADSKEMLFDAEKLDIEIYEIDTTFTQYVFIAAGELVEGENIKLFWQQSVDQGESWTTICEDISYILAEANETDAYRIICVVSDDSGVAQLYCAATIELAESIESQADDSEIDTGLETEDAAETDDTDETQPTGDVDKGTVGDFENGKIDETTALTDSEDESVG